MSDYTQNVSFGPKDSLTTGDPNKRILGTQLDAEFSEIQTAIASKEDESNKGQASGYAPLNASALLADTYLTTNIPRLNAVATFTAPSAASANGWTINLNSSNPGILFYDSDAVLDEKVWEIRSTGGQLIISAWTDAFGGQVTPFSINRTGTTIDTVALAATTVTVNGVSVNNASILTAGTLPDGRFPATLPAASGINLTALNATNLGSGTIPDARFPATLPAASGVNLTALNATNLGSGSIPNARVPASNVTQHQAALAINTDQLTTDYADDASTAFTVGSGDAESIRRFTSSSAVTITLPNSVPSGWAVGDTMIVIRGGTGTITFSTAGTIRSPGTSTVSVQNGKVAVTLAASGVWELSGNV